MSKFLEAVEDNIPEKDLDKITDAKRALQRFLLSKDINVKVKTFRDDVMIELEDGRIVKLEVRDIIDKVDGDKPVEDNEVSNKKVQALTALLSVATPKVTIPGSVSSQVKKTQKAALNNLQRDLKQ